VSDTADTAEELTPEQRRALFRVVRGEPDDAQLAALTVVLAAVAGSASTEPPSGPGSAWNDRHAMLRRPLHPGPGAWRTSTWPR
jgi:hypothetical protein